MERKKLVVGIVYNDPSGILTGSSTPEFFPLQILEVSKAVIGESRWWRNRAIYVLRKKVEPAGQHVWAYAGSASDACEVYFVEHLGHDIASELPENKLTFRKGS